jgi:type 1 glutamine amidotransferase/sugar phosphate isomerase/epimerase
MSWLRRAGAQAPKLSESEQRHKIEAALPAKAFVTPRKPRRLLIFDLNVNYGGHASIPTANVAFTMMGTKTGAFETEVSKDPTIFKPDSLKRFDAVFFNNTVGNLFEDPALRQSLIEFIYAGGGLMGVHGTSVAFMKWPGAIEDWPEFGIMLGARGANHYDSDEHVFVKWDDPTHPLVQPFGGEFEYRDEFFRVHEPYSRSRVRVLLSIDMSKNVVKAQPRGNTIRADNDYALAWVRQYGRGRVFYTTFGHNPYLFWDPKMLQFYLAAAQFALGDLGAPTTPSVKLTPAIRAQERLGWRLGLALPVPDDRTRGSLAKRAADLGLLYMGSGNYRRINPTIAENPNDLPTGDQLRQIRLELDKVGIRIPTFPLNRMPPEEADCRNIFEVGRRMGVEVFIVGQLPDQLGICEKLCQEYDISLAMCSVDEKSTPQILATLCRDCSKRIGVSGNVSQWKRCGVDPTEAVRVLGERLFALQLSNTDEPTDDGQIRNVLTEIHRRGIKPAMFSIECNVDDPTPTVQATHAIELFNKVTVELANGGKS